jgi:hypothetical protein
MNNALKFQNMKYLFMSFQDNDKSGSHFSFSGKVAEVIDD